jgi:short-subunit dehydrogenase
MTQLAHQNVLLTGSSRGLGVVLAEAFAKRGANLALAARSEAGLCEVAESLADYGIEVAIFPIDLAQQPQREQLVTSVLQRFGRIDILVNNAGLENDGAFLDLPWETHQQTLAVNLDAPMQLTYLILPHMIQNKAGHIVHIASVAAGAAGPFDAVYCGTKAGLVEWTRSLRLELEGTGVHFTSIMPGYITEVGMFARFGMEAPSRIGSCTPAQVTQATLRAIEKDQLEVVVNSSPTRLLFVMEELFPSLSDWFKRKYGIVEFQRRKVRKYGS